MILNTVSGIFTVRILLAITVQPVENTVYTLPYTPDSADACRNKIAEYYNTPRNLCCSKCAPGTRQKNECSTTSDTVCEPCPRGQYSGNFNYFPKCFRCPKCSEDKGLQYAQNCSSTTKTQCMCQTGMFCIMEQHPNCEECVSYTHCQPGHGVAIEVLVNVSGTTDSDVNCAPCPDGTFSDQHSYTQTCQHHTDCVSQRRSVLTYGNTTSNAVCGPKVRPPTSPPTRIPTSGTGHTTPSLQSLHTEGKSPGFDLRIVSGVIGGVIGGVILLLIIGTIIYKKVFTGSRLVSSTEDNHGNCEAIKFDSDGPMVLQNSSFITSYQEQQQCLLGKGNCSNPSQAENQQDTRRTWVSGCSNSLEGLSIGPLQSTPPQPSTQPSPQPTSPQPTSPLPSSPLVNVNITVNYPVAIGNGSCPTPTSTHIDSSQADPELPLSREEEVYVNMPQQEGGKEALTAIQESGNDV
ncbi:tumor necrosis factor receptor superfamily member 1B isoform X1 [Salmo salar]|uniref:Tumor necrosis factor receptor superfamily member 1B isoform X1 n=1 Tax=Salmo salar TaxID=8030 RepID=A0ABM3CML8_SALSA|nr:tumor necrosis factor receptor superfamily member 1B-like isoform X1 [Salmo salar]